MPSFVRAFFRCVDDASRNLIVDLLLDDRRRWIERVPTAGWWGQMQHDDVWPFILKKEGFVDFGNDSSDPTSDEVRFAKFQLGDRIVATNEFYNFSYGELNFGLKLEKLTNISEL